MDKSFLTEFKKREYYNQCTDFDGLSDLMGKKTYKSLYWF